MAWNSCAFCSSSPMVVDDHKEYSFLKGSYQLYSAASLRDVIKLWHSFNEITGLQSTIWGGVGWLVGFPSSWRVSNDWGREHKCRAESWLFGCTHLLSRLMCCNWMVFEAWNYAVVWQGIGLVGSWELQGAAPGPKEARHNWCHFASCWCKFCWRREMWGGFLWITVQYWPSFPSALGHSYKLPLFPCDVVGKYWRWKDCFVTSCCWE